MEEIQKVFPWQGFTDKKENKIIVSSWGKMFEFDNRDAKWTSMIKIKVLKN